MKKIFSLIQLIVLVSFTYSQNSSDTFENFKLTNVGFISIPSSMEIQSGKYKKLSEALQKDVGKQFGYEVSDNRVVFQQKGLNKLEQSGFASYARIILETEIGFYGDYETLTTKLTATQTELAEISKQLKSQIQQNFAGTKLKIITWYGVSIETINLRNALKISYLRQLGDNPYVVVNTYHFQNHDRMHSLTLSSAIPYMK